MVLKRLNRTTAALSAGTIFCSPALTQWISAEQVPLKHLQQASQLQLLLLQHGDGSSQGVELKQQASQLQLLLLQLLLDLLNLPLLPFEALCCLLLWC